MNRRIFLKNSFNILGFIGFLLTACQNQVPLESKTAIRIMKLESSAFTEGEFIPKTYTCDGQDISPPLSWDDPPTGTQSFAFIADDPDAPMGTFVHWVIYNLPASTRQLTEGSEPDGIEGKNDFGTLKYGGPCPPGGTHSYFFKLYALDTTLDLPAGAKKAAVLKAMAGHILAEAQLMGRYSRQR